MLSMVMESRSGGVPGCLRNDSGTIRERGFARLAVMMMKSLLALALLVGFSTSYASAQTTTAPSRLANIDATLHRAIAQAQPMNGCSASRPLQLAMYSAQAVDALATGAAVQHGAVGRTPFGTTSVSTAILTQAAFDVIIGMFMRRASCSTKNAINVVIGGSAAFNALQAGSRP